MPFMEWEPRFDIGVSTMNDEHKELITLMNVLYAVNGVHARKSEIVKSAKALADYAAKHFAHEEGYFDSIGFPGAAAHKAIHRKLLAELARHQAEIQAGSGEVSQDFFNFLRFWLAAHICTVDKKYGTFAHETAHP